MKVSIHKYQEAEILLNELFEQADQATPSECRDNVFRDVMQNVEDFLIKQHVRVVEAGAVKEEEQ